jgi:hypothetical protein
MSTLSSAVPAFEVLGTILTVLHLVVVRALLGSEQYHVVEDDGSRIMFAFATHYFFSIFMLCVLSTTPESSVFLDVACDTYSKTIRLTCFCVLVVTTLVFFN